MLAVVEAAVVGRKDSSRGEVVVASGGLRLLVAELETGLAQVAAMVAACFTDDLALFGDDVGEGEAVLSRQQAHRPRTFQQVK